MPFLNMWLSSYLKYIIIAVTAVRYVLLQIDHSDYITHQNVTYGTCISANVLRIIHGLTFPECINECLLRSHCQSVSYYMYYPWFECRLRDSATLEAGSNEDSRLKCLLMSVNGYDAAHLGACASRNCSDYTKCVLNDTVSDGFICIDSECHQPAPSIQNAVLRSSLTDLGQWNSFKCNHWYTGQGDPRIQCYNNGTWSSTAFECIRHCAKPGDLKYATLLTSVSYRSLAGVVIEYQCFNEYYNHENMSVQTRTCSNNGNWQGKVECCYNGAGYVHEFGRCHNLHREEINYDGAQSRCTENGAVILKINNKNKQEFLDSILAAEEAKSSSSEIWDPDGASLSPVLIQKSLPNSEAFRNATKCLVGYGVEVVNNKTIEGMNHLVNMLIAALATTSTTTTTTTASPITTPTPTTTPTATTAATGTSLPCDFSQLDVFMNFAPNQPDWDTGTCYVVSPDDKRWTTVSCDTSVTRAFVCEQNYNI